MNVGGPALQVVGLTEGLRPPRFESRLLIGTVGAGEADYLQLRAPHLPAVRVPGLGRSPNPLGDATALLRVVREIQRFRPHIVHTHTAKAGVLGRVAARLCGVPATVHTFHGHLLYGYFSPGVERCVVQAERLLARSTTRLVAVGAQVRDDLVVGGIGRPDQFTVVPPGVELPVPPTRAVARSALGLPLDARVVAYVARLTAVKRPLRFVDVAEALTATVPDVRFVVAGEGELLAPMQQRARALGDRVHFLGWRRDVETVYAASDVIVLTSDNEGMPVSLIEASWVGTPAVTTDAGSAREVVLDGETGLVTSASVPDIAAATARILLDSELRARMGRAAAQHAARRFGAERLVHDTAELYEDLARQLTFA
ncbi:MAG: glycosyltransferase [Actinomycetota bacterium]|nr:glycosyltransferase [Actinomycetota bacterium]